MGDQKPSVGRMVHYSEDGTTCLAAIIAGVNDDGSVNLSYFARTGGHRQVQNVAETAEAGGWHWPERV